MSAHWSEAGLTELKAAETELALRSPRFAQAFVSRVFDRVDMLGTQPLIGAEVPEYGDPAVRELYEHPYRIVYRVEDERVDVVAVVHSSRRMPRGL